MPVKINDLLIYFKVHETDEQIENATRMSVGSLPRLTEQGKLALERDLLSLSKEEERR